MSDRNYRSGGWLLGIAVLAFVCSPLAFSAEPGLRVGFASVDITPKLDGKPVFLAGFGQNRRATAILDPLSVRAVVLYHGDQKIAIACADLVGLFHPTVERIRQDLPGFLHVLVSSTHNHHGPDTMGIWGPNALTSGVDSDYLSHVQKSVVQAVRDAEKVLKPAAVRISTVTAPELLNDTRLPVVKHDELVVLEFREPNVAQATGMIVQWNCHPETLDSKNTQVSADFVGTVAERLRAIHGCPIVYLSGAIGGMMTTIRLNVDDEQGNRLAEGSVAKTRRYGELLAARVSQAAANAKPLELTPFAVRCQSIALPVDNPRYIVAKQFGVLRRDMERWSGDPYQPLTPMKSDEQGRKSVRTEVSWLRLGELDVAVIPGEIYPELVLGKVQDPADPAADFPDAPAEPAIYAQLTGPYRMIVGLGNDELGYILPKRQWDERPPFTYHQEKAQYGESNSLGPDTGPLICRVFQDLVKGRSK